MLLFTSFPNSIPHFPLASKYITTNPFMHISDVDQELALSTCDEDSCTTGIPHPSSALCLWMGSDMGIPR